MILNILLFDELFFAIKEICLGKLNAFADSSSSIISWVFESAINNEEFSSLVILQI